MPTTQSSLQAEGRTSHKMNPTLTPSFLLPTPGYEENMEKVSSIFTVSSFLLLAAIAITSSPCPHLHLHSPTGFLECSLVPVSVKREWVRSRESSVPASKDRNANNFLTLPSSVQI